MYYLKMCWVDGKGDKRSSNAHTKVTYPIEIIAWIGSQIHSAKQSRGGLNAFDAHANLVLLGKIWGESGWNELVLCQLNGNSANTNMICTDAIQ